MGDNIAVGTVLNNAALARLPDDDFQALLENVPKELLRKIAEHGALGQRLQSEFLGAKVHKKPKGELTAKLHAALRAMEGDELARAVIAAWMEATPAVSEISRRTLGRDDPLSGATNEQFFGDLAQTASPRCIAALRQLALPPPQCRTAKPVVADVSDAVAIESSELLASSAVLSSADEVGTLNRDLTAISTTAIPSALGDTAEGVVASPKAAVVEQGSSQSTDDVERTERTEHHIELRHLSVPDLRRLLSAPLDVFDSVVARDEWIFCHEASGPLLAWTASDRVKRLDRLWIDSLGGVPAPQRREYARSVAISLEASEDWSEALAYWLAVISSGDTSEEVTAGALRTAICASGLREVRSYEPRHLLDTALQTNVTGVRRAVAWALVAISAFDEHFYEELRLPAKTTAELGSALLETYSNLDRGTTRRVNTGQIIQIAARNHSGALQLSRDELGALVRTPSLTKLRDSRQTLLRVIGRLDDIAILDEDRTALDAIRDLVQYALPQYFASRTEGPFRIVTDAIDRSFELAEANKSELVLCILLPTATAVGAAVTSDYEAAIQRHLATITVDLDKPSIPDTGETSKLDVEIRNGGGGDAEDCFLQLDSTSVDDFQVVGDGAFLGRIGAHESRAVSFDVHWSSPADFIDLVWHVDYTDRSGDRSSSGNVRLGRQVPIPWDDIRRTPRYEIASIREIGKLKGRQDQLAELHRGFQGRSSYTITGQKRVGKTSLTQVFLREIHQNDDTLTVYLTISDTGVLVPSQSDILDRFADNVGREIVEEYKEKYEDQPLPLAEPEVSRAGQGLTELGRFINRLIRKRPELRIVIALDDFDTAPESLLQEPTGLALFEWVRSRINTDRVVFLFVGSERLPAIIYGKYGDTLNVIQKITLDYLDREAFESLVRDPTDGILYWEHAAVESVGEWSARNPFFATLICQRIWNNAVKNTDSYVTRRNVLAAVNEIGDTAEQNFFSHFWADSPRDEDENRTLEETKSSRVILALSQSQPEPFSFVPKADVITRAQHEGLRDSAEPQLRELIQRGVLESAPDNPDLIRFRVPLFALWLQVRGIAQIRETRGGRRSQLSRSTLAETLSTREIAEAAQGLCHMSKDVGKENVRAWLEQFGGITRQQVMRKILLGVRRHVYTDSDFQSSSHQLHQMSLAIGADRGIAPQRGGYRKSLVNWYVTFCTESDKSGASSARVYRLANTDLAQRMEGKRLSGEFGEILPSLKTERRPAVVMVVDDFVGTGRSAVSGLQRNILSQLYEWRADWKSRLLVMYAIPVGFEVGINFIREKVGEDVTVLCHKVLGEESRAFNLQSDLWDSDDERFAARQIAEDVGRELVGEENRLGFGGMEAMVVLRDNCPNDSLPILWSNGRYADRDWMPLFPRG